MRLDRLIGHIAKLGRSEVRKRLAAGDVFVGGQIERSGQREIGRFETVDLGERTLQNRVARYVLLNKPAGILSATIDPDHKTVIDLIDEPWADELHLAGRLDRATSGLVILTNDSAFSESLTDPEASVGKCYLVTTDQEVSDEVVEAFEKGVRFAKEGIVTQPATVERLSSCLTRLIIFEGKHHQVKRMFLRFGIRVTGLHRESVGPYHLPANLPTGGYQLFNP